jgi:multiple sugar transport system permease protein
VRSLRSRLGIVALAVGALVMLFPFYWTVETAFSPAGSVLTTPSVIPHHLSLDGFRQLFSTSYDIPFLRVILNSLVLAVVSTVLGVMTSAMAAYAFARLEFRAKGLVFALYLATLMIPLQVLVVPLFVEMRTFHLVDTYEAVLAPNIASAFGVFLIRQAIMAVPRELDEAATIDGCGHLRIFSAIILPNIRPALATFAIFAFMASWNNLLWPLVILSSNDHMTLPLALASLHGQFSTQWNVVMAGSVLSIVPMLLIYASAQKYVVQSMATTGLK